MTAAALFNLVAFLEREMVNPDHPLDLGNVVGMWVERFTCRAAFVHLKGGSETVMAGRLAGTHHQIIRIRKSPQTDEITPAWAVRDEATATSFNIRDVTPAEDRAFLDLLCQSGVAP